MYNEDAAWTACRISLAEGDIVDDIVDPDQPTDDDETVKRCAGEFAREIPEVEVFQIAIHSLAGLKGDDILTKDQAIELWNVFTSNESPKHLQPHFARTWLSYAVILVLVVVVVIGTLLLLRRLRVAS